MVAVIHIKYIPDQPFDIISFLQAEEPPTSQLDDGTEDEIAESNKPEGDLDEGNEETEKEEDRNDIPDEDRNKDENAVGQDGSEDADMVSIPVCLFLIFSA